MATAVEPLEELPPIDERLALPEAGYEIIDGVVTFVAPSDPPHGECHATIAALLRSHAAPAFKVAVDMLTRTSKIDDIAPDVSVFPRAPHPVTGGRQLEQLAFEIVSTQSMSLARKKAAKLAGRGVRRVFAVDLERQRVAEWSRELAAWVTLAPGSKLVDPALAVPLSVDALLETIDVDEEVVRAHVARQHPLIEALRTEARSRGRARGRTEGRAEGRAEGQAAGMARAIVEVLDARGLPITVRDRERLLAERDPERLARWLRAAVTCRQLDELFDA